MLLPIYWYVVTDVLKGLNATFCVNIPKRVKLAALFAMTLKLMNVFETLCQYLPLDRSIDPKTQCLTTLVVEPHISCLLRRPQEPKRSEAFATK